MRLIKIGSFLFFSVTVIAQITSYTRNNKTQLFGNWKGLIWNKRAEGSRWTTKGVQYFGGGPSIWAAGTPVAFGWGADIDDIYIRGADDNVYISGHDNGEWVPYWSTEETLGERVCGPVDSDIAVATSFGRASLFARNMEGHLAARFYTEESDSDFPGQGEMASMGSNIVGTPAALSDETTLARYVWALSTEGKLLFKYSLDDWPLGWQPSMDGFLELPVTDGGPFDVPVKFDGSLTASWACRDYPSVWTVQNGTLYDIGVVSLTPLELRVHTYDSPGYDGKPVLGSARPGTIDWVAQTTDAVTQGFRRYVSRLIRPGSRWYPARWAWRDVGPLRFYGSPAVVEWGDDQTVVVAMTDAGKVVQWRRDGEPRGSPLWETIGDAAALQPAYLPGAPPGARRSSDSVLTGAGDEANDAQMTLETELR